MREDRKKMKKFKLVDTMYENGLSMVVYSTNDVHTLIMREKATRDL